ncbi:hypothetical protein [Pseudarthrobacter sp. NamE5]|uniref:hypothetical protein n=1 Tax=Pseudarthrobacter sp. NamE5 TaxID=2576839 RepID=UPI00110A19E6|nr:hypothetical protein [Pseudarthrobacter sp. NamE5]TLM83120.1 hypothetical protein FDW84_14990 [Pseudarthrobacter sp. NamE5]
MADESAEEAISKVAAEQKARYAANREHFAAQSWYEIDPRLALLLTPILSTDPYATIELTVVVDGTVISGSVVAEQAWAQRQNDQIRIGSPALADAMAASGPSVDELKLEASEETKANPLLKLQDRYIHFLEPVLLSGGTRVRVPATRVDLRKVAAWSIGRIPDA